MHLSGMSKLLFVLYVRKSSSQIYTIASIALLFAGVKQQGLMYLLMIRYAKNAERRSKPLKYLRSTVAKIVLRRPR